MGSTPQPRRRRAPQRAVPQSVRRSGKPLFFGWGAHLTHHEREQVKERIALGIGIVIALAVIGLLVNGWYQDNVAGPAAERAKLNKPVASVGGQKITYGWYHKVLHYTKTTLQNNLNTYQGQLTAAQAGTTSADKAKATQLQSIVSQLNTQLTDASSQTLTQLIDSKVIQIRGPSTGWHPNNKAIATCINSVAKKQFGGIQNLGPDAKAVKLTRGELKSLIADSCKQQQLQKVIDAKVPKTGISAKVRHILISSSKHKAKQGKQLAEKIRRLLEAGGSWNILAKKYSDDGTSTKTKSGTTYTGSRAKGGELGWSLTSKYVPAFRKASDTAPIGAIEIVHSQFGYHVMQVQGRKQVKLSPTDLQTAEQTAFNNWLAKEKKRKGFIHQYIHPGLPTGFPTGSTGTP